MNQHPGPVCYFERNPDNTEQSRQDCAGDDSVVWFFHVFATAFRGLVACEWIAESFSRLSLLGTNYVGCLVAVLF